MKRIMSLTALILALVLLVGCSGGVSIGGFSSKYLNSDDYDAAVQEVMTYFKDFEGCTMKKIGYAGDAVVKAEADARGLAPEQIIVLTSTFETDGENHENGLEPSFTYEDYTWTLTRESSFDPFWVVTDHGMG